MTVKEAREMLSTSPLKFGSEEQIEAIQMLSMLQALGEVRGKCASCYGDGRCPSCDGIGEAALDKASTDALTREDLSRKLRTGNF